MSYSALVTLALLSGAAAQGAGVNQLENARLTQAAQRAEFGIEGDTSAFKFKFSDMVCCNCVISVASSSARASE